MKKNNIKKKILTEDDFFGKGVGTPKNKEKTLDLTEEIKIFLKNPITLESIKYILTRIHGPISKSNIDKEKILIYSIPSFRKVSRFFVVISSKKTEHIYYINSFGIYDLCFFSVTKKNHSVLKNDLSHKIYCWLCENE